MDDAPVFEQLPWHAPLWDRLQRARQGNRLPHALLLSGQPGLGKRRFAEAFAQGLFCEAPDANGIPCNSCRGCHLFLVGNHADFSLIEPEEDSAVIKIGAIRELCARETLTAGAGGYKIILITPADALNPNAANSLLKTLEEPAPGTLMMLITARPGNLPATIRSRCQVIRFPPPPSHESHAWVSARIQSADAGLLLGLSSGAPLQALELDDPEVLDERQTLLGQLVDLFEGRADPVQVAGKWAEHPLPRLLNWMSGWIVDMLRLKQVENPPRLFNPDQRERLHALAQRLDSRVLHRELEAVYEARRLQDTTINPQLLLEGLVINWVRAATMDIQGGEI